VIIHDLDGPRAIVLPTKPYSISIIDPDAVLALAVTFQSFQPITGRIPQIIQRFGKIESAQPARSYASKIAISFATAGVVNLLRFVIFEVPDHTLSVSR